MSGQLPSFDVFRDSGTGLGHAPNRRSGSWAPSAPIAWDAKAQTAAIGCAVSADAWGQLLRIHPQRDQL